MSPAHPSPEPLRRTNINFFQSDIDYLESRYGVGWQTQLRLHVRDWIREMQQVRGKTLGEMIDDEPR